MPLYSNKMALTMIEEPPYLTIGTDVSAKYKGAFCEAKIIDVNRNVKLRVLFKGQNNASLIDDADLKPGCEMKIGSQIEAKHPDKGNSFIEATVTKVIDHSRYTVLFDDGDQSLLRRNSLCLKSGKHFAESETLDQLPLTNPEHFGNPVKVGQTEHSSSANSLSHSSSNSALESHAQKCINNVSHTKSPTRKDDISNHNKSATDLNNSVKKRGPGVRGRKKKEPTAEAPKPPASKDKDSEENISDNVETNRTSNVIFDSIDVGVKLKVKYGKNLYEAKVNKFEFNSAGIPRYFVHYTGWNNRYDEWITKSRIIDIVKEPGMKRKYKERDSISELEDSKKTDNDLVVKKDREVPLKRERLIDKEKEPEPKKKYKERERDKVKAKEEESDKEAKDMNKVKEKDVVVNGKEVVIAESKINDTELPEREPPVKRKKAAEKEVISKRKCKEKDDEKQKQKEKEIELKRLKAEKEKEIELERVRELEREREKEIEKERERLELERQELEKLKELEKEKEREKEKEKEREKEREREKEKERLKEREKAKERDKAKEIERAKEREKEKERDKEKDREKDKDRDKEKEKLKEKETKKEPETKRELETKKDSKKDKESKKVKDEEKEKETLIRKKLKEREQFVGLDLTHDLDKRIYYLQDCISVLRQAYIKLRARLAHLDKKTKGMSNVTINE